MNVFNPADILLPKNIDLGKWSVVACDQYTSQKEYWDRVERYTEKSPSTYQLIFPEAMLGSVDFDAKVASVNAAMHSYLQQNLFTEYKHALILVRRRFPSGKVRTGLVGAIDLEAYDYKRESRSSVRATEATVSERIPPRVTIRRHAPLELPHILLLMDDPEDSVLAPLKNQLPSQKVYDFELMENSGHITGYLIDDAEAVCRRIHALSSDPLIAVGDGNHSLAGAKACWEECKKTLSPDAMLHHPMRYALCELVNLHEPSLVFEPIYRVFFDCQPPALFSAMEKTQGVYSYTISCLSGGEKQQITFASNCHLVSGAITEFLEDYAKDHEGYIDYIHGLQTAEAFGSRKDAVAFLIDCLKKEDLFSTINTFGPLPKKTFSMGEAEEKRFYVEARKLVSE